MIIAIDTTSYPNLTLETVANEDGSLRRYNLRANEGYVIHEHETCTLPDPENGIEGECFYSRVIYLPRSTDLSTINDYYVAVLESTVPADSIFGGGDNNHEVM